MQNKNKENNLLGALMGFPKGKLYAMVYNIGK
jgi:hypothetical protein